MKLSDVGKQVSTIMGKTVHYSPHHSETPMVWIYRKDKWLGEWDVVTCILGGNTLERKDMQLTFRVNKEVSNYRLMQIVNELLPITHQRQPDDEH